MNPAVQAVLPGEVDVFFLDTSHEYEHTLAELRAYMPRVAPGGIALFHDTNLLGWPGYDWDSTTPPVQAALDDWCAGDGPLMGEPARRVRTRGDPAVRCPGCG